MNRRNDLNNQNLIVKLLNNGINTDVDLELLGSLKKNFCVELENMRPNSDEGNYAALEKIGGEVLLYDNLPVSPDDHFRCLVAELINGKLLAVWGGFKDTTPCRITIDSEIVLESTKLPYNAHSKIQYDFDESCGGGMIFLTDNVIAPVYLDIQDMLDNNGKSQKYYSEFDYVDYTPNLNLNVSAPVFDTFNNVGEGGGVPVGMYSYAIRFVTKEGDKTGISVPTPLIPVAANRRQFTGDLFKGYKTMGADADPTVRTEFAPVIKFRVVNDNDYDYVEILRTSYNDGAGLGFTPDTKIVDTIDLSDGEIDVKTFIDDTDPSTHIAITDSESNESLSIIEAAKSVRYFKGRVNLFNLKYKSAVVDDEVEFKMDGENVDAYPVSENVGKFGLNDAENAVYKRPYFHGERYGFSMVIYDSNFQPAFSIPLPGFENYQFPNRRDPLSGSSNNYSSDAAKCADVNGNVNPTFELFDMKNAENRGSDYDSERINILCAGSKDGDSADSFDPRLPSSPSDERHNHEKRNIVDVYLNGSTSIPYDPFGFSPEYLSLALEMAGLDSWPDWASGFSIVRTERGGRIICQGLGFYSMTAGNYGDAANSKALDEIWFQSPDILNGIVDSNVLNDFINDPSSYKIQLVSPVGFHMDVYDAERTDITPSTSKDVDMILHANVMAEYDGKRINAGDVATDIGIADGNNGYVAYGKWRNPAPAAGSVFDDADDGNRLFGVLAVDELNGEEGTKIFKIRLDANIYRKETTGGGGAHFNETGLKEFHEPVYAVNIIKEGNDAPQGGGTKYFHTGHFQKFVSKLGVSNGSANETFEIVDERVEDFHTTDGSADKYVFIKDGDQEKRFININNKSSANIQTIKDDIDNGTNNYNGSTLHGIYTSTEDEIIFSESNYLPPFGSEVLVRYDNTAPVRVFGGDASFGEFTYPFIHMKTTSDDATIDGGGGWLYHGMPYYEVNLASNIYVAIRATGSVNRIQDRDDHEMGYIRQMLVMMNLESFSALPMQYNDCFPVVNYVQRPHRWDDQNYDNNYIANGGNVCDDYLTEYGDEHLRWGYGGFHINFYPINIDYSKIIRHSVAISKPETGFTEVTRFCTRIHTSLKKQVSNPNNQRIKTFPPLNTYDLSDKNGEIMRGWSANSGRRGDNLFAFCKRDIAILITDKKILSERNGNELASIGEDESSFILQSIFINEGVGISEKMIGLFAEYGNICMFGNSRSIYIFDGSQIKDVLKGMFKKELFHNYIKKTNSSQFNRLSGYYDKRYDDFILGMSELRDENDDPMYAEYADFKNGLGVGYNYSVYLDNEAILIYTSDYNPGSVFNVFNFSTGGSFVVANYNIEDVDVVIDGGQTQFTSTIKSGEIKRFHDDDSDGILSEELDPAGYNFNLLPIIRKLFVYSTNEEIKNWIGSFSYQFDKYVSDEDGRLYGLRDMNAFELYSGNEIDGENIKSKASISISPNRVSDKELESIFLNSNRRPTKIEILDESFNVIRVIPDSEINNFKHVFQQYSGRRDDTTDRVQGTYFIIRVYDEKGSDFILRSIGAEFKMLK